MVSRRFPLDAWGVGRAAVSRPSGGAGTDAVLAGRAKSRLMPHQVVGGAHEVPAQPGAVHPAIARLRNPPTVFIQPKISSTRLRIRWLTA